MNNTKKGFGYIILLAPLIFIFHFWEEASGFVSWFNQHVDRGISYRLFWSVNISALVITLFVIAIELIVPSVFSASLIILWFSFLMFANAILHITGSMVDKAYVPGLITAIILYIPFYFLIVRSIVKGHRMKTFPVVGLGLLGALPMLIHDLLTYGERIAPPVRTIFEDRE